MFQAFSPTSNKIRLQRQQSGTSLQPHFRKSRKKKSPMTERNMTAHTDLVCCWSGSGVGLRHDLMLWPSGASLLATVGSFIHTLLFSSAARERGRGRNTQYALPFALAWLMPELLSPHFIWWSSASSPPLLLIRHGSPLSLPSLTRPSLSLPLPSFWFQLWLPSIPASLHCAVTFYSPPPSFLPPLTPFFKKRIFLTHRSV